MAKILKVGFWCLLTLIINLMILKSYANIDNMNLTVKIKNISVCENEIAVTMSNREMTVSSFTCGIHYDRESLKLISISGCDVSDSDKIGIKRNSDGSIWEVFAVSTMFFALST